MVKVIFKRFPKNRLMIKVSGHANPYGDQDKDYQLICASASILTYTIAQNVKDMQGNEWLNGEPTINLAEGNSSIKLSVKKERALAAEQIISSIGRGYSLLKENFPEQVDFIKFGKRE